MPAIVHQDREMALLVLRSPGAVGTGENNITSAARFPLAPPSWIGGGLAACTSTPSTGIWGSTWLTQSGCGLSSSRYSLLERSVTSAPGRRTSWRGFRQTRR